MPPAARAGDPTNHGGVVGPPPGPAATVFIGGKPAAVMGSTYTCANPYHPPNTVVAKPTRGGQVLIGGAPAAKMLDNTACGAQIMAGAPNVLIGGPL
ncbi:MAG: PAAR domain-containing protein [Saccharopolyspora sp.]|uniref:PAAR domain-containing protein n=1 Tax=Saccharopolyspora TaxID=1835 RepID=UPI0019093278|nr:MULTISPECIES: PAAR domain-containing protein [unclassified Saccharopolyspora]MBK0866984.1 PAAR domain-containing protein [Saccharopolyspora sp. HNM0986]MBQ6640708.1 PAAR domain-containing protein [Saccharopolyspora sp.]